MQSTYIYGGVCWNFDSFYNLGTSNNISIPVDFNCEVVNLCFKKIPIVECHSALLKTRQQTEQTKCQTIITNI